MTDAENSVEVGNWQQAHLELLATLPVRTHEWRPHEPEPLDEDELAMRRAEIAERRRRVAELVAAGLSEYSIARELGISRTAVQRHKRALAGLPQNRRRKHDR